ncbi:MAG: DUF502 domain-containing protein [Planctomycetota bacterium]
MNDVPQTTESSTPPLEKPGWVGIRKGFRSRITAGLILVLPIWITVVVVSFVFRLMRDASLWLVEAFLFSPIGRPLLSSWGVSSEQLAEAGVKALPSLLAWGIGLLSVVLTIGLLYALGAVTTNVLGNRVVRAGETLVDRLPFIKVVYQSSKKVLETFTAESTRAFQRVVLVPFPTKDAHTVGFVTHVSKDARTGEELYSLFVPTVPNPTTGYVLIVRPSDVIELDWSIEQAVKAIMSGGVLMPDTLPIARKAAT